MPNNVHIQLNELEMLAILGDWGIADTEMLWHRFYPRDKSGNYCRHRLGLIRGVGLTQSFPFTINRARATKRGTKSVPQKQPTAWQLTASGADQVHQLTGVCPPRYARSDSLSAVTLPHRVGVIRDIRVPFDDAAKLLGLTKPLWIMEQDQYEDREVKLTDPAHKRFILYESFPLAGAHSHAVCRPDIAGLHTIPTNPPLQLVAYGEYERLSDGARIAEKALGYKILLDSRTKLYRQHWPNAIDTKLNRDFARVLYVIGGTKDRLTNVREVIKPMPGAEYWRFALAADLKPPPNALTAPVWQDVHGKAMSILPPNTTTNPSTNVGANP